MVGGLVIELSETSLKPLQPIDLLLRHVFLASSVLIDLQLPC